MPHNTNNGNTYLSPPSIPVFARLQDWFGPYRLPSGLVVRLVSTGHEDGIPVAHLQTETGDQLTVTRHWFAKVAKAI